MAADNSIPLDHPNPEQVYADRVIEEIREELKNGVHAFQFNRIKLRLRIAFVSGQRHQADLASRALEELG